MKALLSFETSENTNPATRRHIPEELNPLHLGCLQITCGVLDTLKLRKAVELLTALNCSYSLASSYDTFLPPQASREMEATLVLPTHISIYDMPPFTGLLKLTALQY